MKKPPCENCLLVPRCRLKHYMELIESCIYVSDYLFEDIHLRTKYGGVTEIIKKRKRYNTRLGNIYRALNPRPIWGYKMEHTKTHMTLVDAATTTSSFYLVRNPNNQIGERFTLRSALRNKWFNPKKVGTE